MNTETIDVKCLNIVRDAEEAFLSRWRLSSLQRVDAELYSLLEEQRQLFENALFGPNEQETETQAQATVRGWKAANQAMIAISQPDDAWLIGTDPSTGIVVAIGERGKAAHKIKDGQRLVYVTPDEVAKLVAGVGLLADLKQVFPGAEVVEIVRGTESQISLIK
jgi:hypothetical protein